MFRPSSKGERSTISGMELSAVAGGLLGLLKVHLDHPDDVDAASLDDLARALLRLLGIPDEEAARIVALDLPATQSW